MNTHCFRSVSTRTMFTLTFSLACCISYSCLALQKDTLAPQKARSPAFAWGANGHPLNQIAYWENLPEQINVLTKIGLSYYRVDMDQAADGTIAGPAVARLEELLRQASAAHITIVPILFPPHLKLLYADSNLEKKYGDGFFAGQRFAGSYGKSFHYYELGNENDVQLMSASDDGSDSSHYDIFKLKCLAATLRGMENGIKSVDPSAEIIISNAGWMHYAYFHLLEAEGVSIDIIGYHWYEKVLPLKRVLRVLRTDFKGKRVWFTEINKRSGARINDNAQTRRMKRYLCVLHRLGKSVNGFFVYELFDQPESTPAEQNYGMVSWQHRYTDFTYKPFALWLEKAIKKYQQSP